MTLPGNPNQSGNPADKATQDHENGEIAQALDLLTTRPDVYYAFDWWSGRAGGHGIHYRKGKAPDESLQNDKYLATEGLTKRIKETGVIEGDWWYHGKGLVLKTSSELYNEYLLDFQKKGEVFDYRPEVVMQVVIPRSPDFEKACEAIEDDASAMLELFSRVAPPELDGALNNVQLASPRVIIQD